MSSNAARTVSVTFTGDVALTINASAVNASSPATEQLVTLIAGDNTFTVPATGAAATSLTIIKPAGNTVTLKLKGAGADTGIILHKTDPDVISLDPTETTVIINATTQVVGVRLVWA